MSLDYVAGNLARMAGREGRRHPKASFHAVEVGGLDHRDGKPGLL